MAVEQASNDADGCCRVNQDCHEAGSSSPCKSRVAKIMAKIRGASGLGDGEERPQLNERWHRWARPWAIAKPLVWLIFLKEIVGIVFSMRQCQWAIRAPEKERNIGAPRSIELVDRDNLIGK